MACVRMHTWPTQSTGCQPPRSMRGIPYRKRPDPHPARTPAPRTPATRLQRTIARTASAKPCTQSSLPRHCARGMCAPNAHYKCRYAIRPPSCPNARLPPDPRHGAAPARTASPGSEPPHDDARYAMPNRARNKLAAVTYDSRGLWSSLA